MDPNLVQLRTTGQKLDRRAGFVIYDEPENAPDSIFATKALATCIPGERRKQVTAIAIREHGTNKQANILRSYHCVPSAIHDAFHTWIAVTRSENWDNRLLFSGQENSTSRVGME